MDVCAINRPLGDHPFFPHHQDAVFLWKPWHVRMARILVSSLHCLRLRFVLYCFLSQFPQVTLWSLWVQGPGIHSMCCSFFTQVDSGATSPRCYVPQHISNYFPRNSFAATSMCSPIQESGQRALLQAQNPYQILFIQTTTSKSCWAWRSYLIKLRVSFLARERAWYTSCKAVSCVAFIH